MNIHTPSENVLVKRLHLAAITAAAVNGLVVDSLGYRNLMFVLSGAPSGSGTTLNAKLQAGNASDGSDMADVAGATFDQLTTAGGAGTQLMNVTPLNKRYFRVVVTGAGGSAAGVFSVECHLFNPAMSPVTQDVAAKVIAQSAT